ncbi:hypothetical protein HJC23_005055 [Cyclotella cryptica]|uniref:Calmodulin n=1 Tax=Cyclotella cryptica TaxID=29204 RepID=A0ABD3QDG1_9STRA|eukprot:CCRYP_006272-RA/>CCRYP_006272-RA protein AED:0.22 eAED:0.22 QI:0/-1/0/1/-1/1/1/0/387
MSAPIRFVRYSLSTCSIPNAIPSCQHSRPHDMPYTSFDFRRRFRSAPSQRNEDATAAATETNSYKRKSSRVSPYGRLRRKLDAKRREEESALFVHTNERSHDLGETPSPKSPPTSAPTTQQHKDGHEQSTTSSSSNNNNNNNTEQKKTKTASAESYSGHPWKTQFGVTTSKANDHGNIHAQSKVGEFVSKGHGQPIYGRGRGGYFPRKRGMNTAMLSWRSPTRETATTMMHRRKKRSKEKAADAANQISQNVQKNISTIQQEAPKLLSTAQKLTGISTREELREWVSEQLKLGTECLSMFMKGYREGRDEEVDKMLHEYFKELDQDKGNEILTKEGSESIEKESIDRSGHDIGSESKVVQKRPWGRKERRRFKATGQQIPMVDVMNS